MSKHPYEILKSPVLAEKAVEGQTMTRPQYTFKVHPGANKIEIRQAIELAFGVKVTKVNTVSLQGKRKRLRTMHFGRRPDWKKAIVTLEEEQSINLI